ncbi:type II toxin-antitoxin system Phd/YefM family antitoxin [Streptomyces sp. NPDC002730]|uniref:type II toxin-antitoxin system Phd/YefM family antitoxin n=1 Tax=Streptomyces sp. NPDC002730 TaxID=3364662 RepID=UPI00369EF532
MNSIELTDAVQDFGRLVALVEETGERVTLTEDGLPVSVLLPAAELAFAEFLARQPPVGEQKGLVRSGQPAGRERPQAAGRDHSSPPVARHVNRVVQDGCDAVITPAIPRPSHPRPADLGQPIG